MKRLLKKPVNRGAPMCAPLLLLLMIVGILSLARARPVEASKVTSCDLYCYSDLHNGNFKQKVKKYNKKGLKAKFNYGSRYVWARDAYPDKNGKYHVKKYDLKKHVVEGDDSTPYRYWFWIRCTRHHNAGYHDNSLYPSASRSGYVQTWSTESFAVTQSKLTTKSQNVMQYKSRPGGYTEVHRMVEISDRKWNASHSKKKHHSLVNTLGTTSGDNYGMDFYMVDLQKWFLKNNANSATFSGTLYFHHITRLNYSGGGAAYRHITSRARWESLARRHGFRSSGIATYPQYYNLKMKFKTKMKHKTWVYRLHTTKRHGRMGAWDKDGVPIEECQFKHDQSTDKHKGNHGLLWKKETPAGSIYKFKKNVTTYKDSDKQKYFLKGIRVEAKNYKKSKPGKEVYDRIAQFMITDDLNHNPVTGQENVKFNCYAKPSKKNSGIYLDNASLKQYNYTQRYQYGYKDDAHNVFRSWHLSNLKKPKSVRSNRKKVMSGKKTWKQCMDYLCNLYFKNTVSDNRIYLIYQKADKGMLSVNEEFYDYDYSKGDYVMADTTRVTERKLPSRNSTLSAEKINKMYQKEKGKTDARIICTFRTRNSVRYYAQEYMMTYYAASDHKKKTMKINLDSICPKWHENYQSHLPRKDKYFSGNWDEMQKYMNVIAAMRSYFNTANCPEFKKVDFSKNVVVTVKLYQPKTPTTVVRYYDNGHSLEKIDSKFLSLDHVNSMTGESTILNKSYAVESAPKLVKESKTSYHLASDEEIAAANAPLPEGVEAGSSEDKRPVIVGARFESLSSHVAYHHRYHLGKEGEDPAYSQNEWDGIGDPRVIARHNKYKVSGDERTIEFPTNLRGNLVVEVWKDPIPEYTVEYYAGYKKMPDNYIIPEDMDKATEDADSEGAKVEYNRVYANTVKVDTEPGGNPPPDYITETFSIPETLAGIKGVGAGEKYKLVPKKSKALEDTSLQKKGLPVDSSRGVELKWRYGSTESITLRYYYLRLESNQIITTPTPSPGVTPTPSGTPVPEEEITIYKWDDTNNTELGRSDNPTEQGNLDNAEITGQIYKDKIQKGDFDSGTKEVQTDFEDQMTADTDDRFVIPNGRFVGGKYEPNTVKSNAQNTAYLSKGKILKHVVTTKVPVTVYRSVYHKSSGKYSKQYATIPIVVQAAYFTVDELTVWRPEGAKVYNYAFPNSSGKKEGLDADGDCRSVAKEWWKDKDYNVNLAKNTMYGEWLKSNDKNWGSVEKTGCYKVNLDKNDQLLTVKAPTVTVKGDSDPDKSSMNSTLLNRLPEIVRKFWNKDTVKSDTLTFNHPDWEDLEEGAVVGDEKADKVVVDGKDYDDDNYEDSSKINIGKGAVTVTDAKEDISETKHVETLLKANTVTVKVCDSQGKVSSGSLKCKDPNSSNDEEAGDLVDFDKMSKWDERKLRIPPAKLSKNSGEETNGNTNLFTLNGIPINQSKLNTKEALDGPESSSRVSVHFVPFGQKLNSKMKDGWVYSESVNGVVLHTPVAVKAEISKWDQSRSQSIIAHNKDNKNVTLGTPFKVSLDYRGNFADVGYGVTLTGDDGDKPKHENDEETDEKNSENIGVAVDEGDDEPDVTSNLDTKPFLLEQDTAYFTFPFDVYYRNEAEKEAHCVLAKHRFKVKGVSKTVFYPAYWAKEAEENFTIDVEALNTIGQDKMVGIENRQDRIVLDANVQRDYYVAQTVVTTDLSGILTNLRITDVADYPTLQNVFRKNGEGDSRYDRTGYAIHSGTTNFLGQENKDKDTYPVVNGDTLNGVKYGVFKPGYKIRINVDTIASLTGRLDTVRLVPKFYWVKKTTLGESDRVPVKVFYDENVNGVNRKLVEVGGTEDQNNRHALCIGDKENNCDFNDLVDSAKLQNYTVDELTKLAKNSWSYGEMVIPGNMKVSEGNKNLKVIEVASDGARMPVQSFKDAVYADLGVDKATGAEKEKLQKQADEKVRQTLNNCLQNWYGEYYLPNSIHVLTEEDYNKFTKDPNTVTAAKNRGIDINDSHWKKDGYLLVNFEVKAYKSELATLAYNAKKTNNNNAYCDMWHLENKDFPSSLDEVLKGKSKYTKTDNRTQKFTFQEGDMILYDLSSAMSDDYNSGGTH